LASAVDLVCFWLACFFADFGDLSPIILNASGFASSGLHPVSGGRGYGLRAESKR
jgi:hypothetical protein